MARADPAGGRLAAVAKHAALVLFGLAAALLLLELGLRAAGLVVRSVGQRDGGAAPGERVVLCVGDSHTYGAPLPGEDAYPAQLQQRLDALDPDARWRVINRGIPGMNSAQVAAELEGWILHDRPAAVVVWVGANDWWNRDDPRAGAGAKSAWRRLLEGSRAYRLYRTFTAQSALADWDRAAGEVVERSDRWLFSGPRSPRDRYVHTLRALSAIAATLAQHGLPWLIVTYPQPEYRWQRSAAERVAERSHAAIVHSAEDLARARRDHPEAVLDCPWPAPEGRACLFVESMGPHPTRLLYGYVAASIADALLALP